LEIYDQNGPLIGFHDCKDHIGTNQDWAYEHGEIRSLYSPNSCVVIGSTILVYTNGDLVELIVDGASIGKQQLQPFDSGNFLFPAGMKTPNNVTAIVTKNGRFWAQDMLFRHSSGTSISLEVAFPENGLPINSDGQDVALLTASVKDIFGNIVISAQNVITFTVTDGNGTIVGTGNGNPYYDLRYPDTGNMRPVWNGFARAVVGTGMSDTMGGITVQATSPGLSLAEVTIPTEPIGSDKKFI